MNINKKIIAFVLAGIFAISMVVPANANAATLEEQIASLSAMIVALQAEIAGQTASATAVCFDADLQKGMTSDSVKDLQIKLGVTPTSGYFGPITLAAVKTFQTSNGIINTGYVGPLTRGALNALYCTASVPSTTYPAGCTSAVGFSITTGLSCAGAVTYPAGCTSAVGFSPTTGLSCAVEAVTYPEGCTSAVGFSPTTGLSCAGTTTTTVGPSYGTLSVQTYPVSNPVTTLYGGQTYELLAAQYKATGSDITLRKVAVEVIDSNKNSFPWQVFNTISLWDGSTMLVELPVTQANAIENTFAEDYTFNVSGLNLVISNGQQKVLTVKGSVLGGNPVATVTDGTYTVKLLGAGTVYADTAGVTYTSVTTDITKASLTIAASQSSAITTTLATDNPLAGNIIGSTSATTRVDLLKFNVKVENINGTFNSGVITATSSDDKLVSVELWDGGTLVAAAAPAASTGIVSWTNFTLPVSAGVTKTFIVKGVIAQLTSGYTTGGTVQVTSGPVLKGVDVNSNVITADGHLVTGAQMRVYLVAPVFTFIAPSVVEVRGSGTDKNDIGSTSITFSVTAKGGDIYLPSKLADSDAIYETLTGSTAAAVKAAGTITFAGTYSADGIATVTINDIDVTFAIVATATPTNIGAGIVAAIEANTTLNALVGAVNTTGVIALTAKTAGYAGNSITLVAAVAPVGDLTVAVSGTNLTGGINTGGVTDTTWTCNAPVYEDTNYWKIPFEQSANCTYHALIVNTGGTAGYFSVAVKGVNWGTDGISYAPQEYGLTNIKTSSFYLGK